MSTLNIYKYGIFNWKIRNWPHNFKQVFRNLKCAHQRASKGYCDFDLHDLGQFYIDLIDNSLDALSKSTMHSIPADMQDFSTNWINYLKEMRQHFHNASVSNNVYTNEYEDDLLSMSALSPDDHIIGAQVKQEKDELWAKAVEREKEINALREEELNRGIQMLAGHIYDLWD